MQLRILGGLELTSAAGAPAPDVTRQTRLMLACLAPPLRLMLLGLD